MGNSNRIITKNLGLKIGLNGAREGDEFHLEVFQERKRAFNLNRTRYIFKAGKTYDFDTINAVFTLPEFSLLHAEYEFVLINMETSEDAHVDARYLMRSLGEEPFRLNGIYCFEAFLERGDVLDLGFNRILIGRKKVCEKKSPLSTEGLSKEIIKSRLPILIEGDTGTGKSTLAKLIHEESGRRGSFVHLNLNSFSSSLLESELFGHVKGAFTGAIHAKKGAILEANHGTLFLDEIDSISIDLQTKLLLFLDNYNFRAVGGENFLQSDVRIIFASGSSLVKKVQEEKMRKDFYFRLRASAYLRLLPLEENKEKIKEVCLQFENNHLVVIDYKLIEYYTHCPWPGNIRQLKSHLEKKRLLTGGKKMVFDEQDEELITSVNFNLSRSKDEIEPLEDLKMRYCYEIFLKKNKNITTTAASLKISINTLKTYLNKFSKIHNII